MQLDNVPKHSSTPNELAELKPSQQQQQFVQSWFGQQSFSKQRQPEFCNGCL